MTISRSSLDERFNGQNCVSNLKDRRVENTTRRAVILLTFEVLEMM